MPPTPHLAPRSVTAVSAAPPPRLFIPVGDAPSACLRGELSQAVGGGPGGQDSGGSPDTPALGAIETALRLLKAGKGQSSGEYSRKGWSCARTFICVPGLPPRHLPSAQRGNAAA